MSLLFYKRPDYVRDSGPLGASDYQDYLEKTRKAIPPELCFENVVTNRAMPPCTLEDFMGYMVYVSHDAENLQFYLWLQSYTRRFYAASGSEQALSPPWQEEALPQQYGMPAESVFKMSEKTMAKAMDYKISFEEKAMSPMSEQESFMNGSLGGTLNTAEYTNVQSGLKWQPFTIQPFRAEINRVIAHYLAPGATRELNLSSKDRASCLHALQHTTHPSAFSIPDSIVTQSLRDHSHPSFIRWSAFNGNRPRILFGRVLGAFIILSGFILAIILTLSYKSRWWRLFAALAWFLGFSFLLAGSNGICLVLYVTHDRHLRPWEQYSTDTSSNHSCPYKSDDEEITLGGSDVYSMSHGGRKRHLALETFGTANSYGSEVWVDKYRAKMMIRKIFDRTVWVQNESVRLLQDRVALQAVIWSVVATVPLTILFTALPTGHLFR